MNKREGIVISISEKYANLLTPYGEFIKVNCAGKKPNIGEEFIGNEVKAGFFYSNTRKIVTAACILFILSIGGGVKAYYSPSATVLVSINPYVELKVNFLNRIISSRALNNDGNKILNQVDINNTNINDGLRIIIDQSKKDKFIDSDYTKTKTISIDIDGKGINISKFKSQMKASNLNIEIESNGNVILNKNSIDNSKGSVKATDNILNKVEQPSTGSSSKKPDNINHTSRSHINTGSGRPALDKNNEKKKYNSRGPHQYNNKNGSKIKKSYQHNKGPNVERVKRVENQKKSPYKKGSKTWR